MIHPVEPCRNYNHGHPNAGVRYCPQCGEVVNAKFDSKRCSQDEHTKSRRDRNKFCVDCGEQLTIRGLMD